MDETKFNDDVVLNNDAIIFLQNIVVGYLFRDKNIVKCYINPKGELGCLFEEYVHFFNKCRLIPSKIVGGDNAPCGSDLIISGNHIQLKLYNRKIDFLKAITAKKGINKGNYKYTQYFYKGKLCSIDRDYNPYIIDSKGVKYKPKLNELTKKKMGLMVGKGQKSVFKEFLEGKKGFEDIPMKESFLSRMSVKEMSKPFTIRSLAFDILLSLKYVTFSAIFSSLTYFGLNFIINLIKRISNGKPIKKAIVQSLKETNTYRCIWSGIESSIITGTSIVIREQVLRVIKAINFKFFKDKFFGILKNPMLSSVSTICISNGVFLLVDYAFNLTSSFFHFFSKKISIDQLWKDLLNDTMRFAVKLSGYLGGLGGFLLFGIPGMCLGGIGLTLILSIVYEKTISKYRVNSENDGEESQRIYNHEIKRIFEEEFPNLNQSERVLIDSSFQKKKVFKSTIKKCYKESKEERELTFRKEIYKEAELLILESYIMREKCGNDKFPDDNLIMKTFKESLELDLDNLIDKKNLEKKKVYNSHHHHHQNPKKNYFPIIDKGNSVRLYTLSDLGNIWFCEKLSFKKKKCLFDWNENNDMVVIWSNDTLYVKSINFSREENTTKSSFIDKWTKKFYAKSPPMFIKFVNNDIFVVFCKRGFYLFEKINKNKDIVEWRNLDSEKETSKPFNDDDIKFFFVRDCRVICISSKLFITCYNKKAKLVYKKKFNVKVSGKEITVNNADVLALTSESYIFCCEDNLIYNFIREFDLVVSNSIHIGEKTRYKIIKRFNDNSFVLISKDVSFYKIVKFKIQELWRKKIDVYSIAKSQLTISINKSLFANTDVSVEVDENSIYLGMNDVVVHIGNVLMKESKGVSMCKISGFQNRKKIMQMVDQKLVVLCGNYIYICNKYGIIMKLNIEK